MSEDQTNQGYTVDLPSSLVERGGNGRYVRWSSIAIIAAIAGPLIAAGAGYGALSAKVDSLTVSNAEAAQRAQRTDEAINSLNVSVAKLSGAVEALTRRLPDTRGGP